MWFLQGIYQLTSNEVNYSIPEYQNIKYYSSLPELLTASRDPNNTVYNVHVIGNENANHIVGSSLANDLNGGVGADTLEGGARDDIYTVDNAGDVVIELAGNGIDGVGSYVSYTLSANVENLFLYGSGRTADQSFENLDGTGNTLDNTLQGTAGNNHLSGLGGNDTLIDVGGVDTLEGGSGDDRYYIDSSASTIIEAANGGRDTAYLLFEVRDLDTFKFEKFKNVESIHFAKLTSTGKYTGVEDGEVFIADDKLNPNKAADFDDFEAKEDTIALSKAIFSKIAKKGALKKDAFWTGSKAHDKNDRVIYDKKAGDLYYDADGSGSRKAVKFADVDKNLKVAASDFLVF
jgi:Ca2+-binding RTX toxin-like protein